MGNNCNMLGDRMCRYQLIIFLLTARDHFLQLLQLETESGI